MPDESNTSQTIRPLSVSELNRQARNLLEQGIPRLWVEGEISNLARPGSGHIYFSLKDESAQIRCAYFKQRQRGSSMRLEDGDQALVLGRVSIYETRGDYQLIVEQVEAAGEGELRRRFEALKKKLAAEGLFDDELKRPLPELPERIGIVTSPSGAALHDILTVLKRRFPAIPVVIYPTAVQGDAAAQQIVDALRTAGERAECDVLIVARGGGSLEDLWPFNEESVARAIAACPIPVVSAVGHEIDFTISDFVADLRAPTPSGAAERVVPDQAEWLRTLEATSARLASLARRCLEDHYQQLDWLARRLSLSSPATILARQSDWLRNLTHVLSGAIRHDLLKRVRAFELTQRRLLDRSPARRILHSIHRLTELNERLRSAGRARLVQLDNRLNLIDRALRSVNPSAVLERGYAIVTDTASGRLLRDASMTESGRRIRARLARGSLLASVERVDAEAGPHE